MSTNRTYQNDVPRRLFLPGCHTPAWLYAACYRLGLEGTPLLTRLSVEGLLLGKYVWRTAIAMLREVRR